MYDTSVYDTYLTASRASNVSHSTLWSGRIFVAFQIMALLNLARKELKFNVILIQHTPVPTRCLGISVIRCPPTYRTRSDRRGEWNKHMR